MKRLGVIGLGTVGHRATSCFREQGHEVVGTGRDREDRDAFFTEFDAVVADSIAELLDHSLDGVFVATPNRYHEEHVRLVLEAGYDVLIQKPIAHRLAEARRIATLADESDAACYVAYQFRCSDVFRTIRAAVSDGAFGDIYHVEGVFSRPRDIPAVGSWYTSRDLSGGGALNDIGVHWLDTALHVLDFPTVDDVSGVVRQRFDPHEYDIDEFHDDAGSRRRSDVEDSATAVVEFDDGRSLSLEAHWAANQPQRRDLRLYGDRAGLVVDTLDQSVETIDHDDVGAPSFDGESLDWRLKPPLYDSFLQAIDGEATPLTTPTEAVTIQSIVERVYEGTWVER
jgi:predicted dehydrogenase